MGRNVLITDAGDFVGPAAVDRFRAGGDAVPACADGLTAYVEEPIDEAVRIHTPGLRHALVGY